MTWTILSNFLCLGQAVAEVRAIFERLLRFKNVLDLDLLEMCLESKTKSLSENTLSRNLEGLLLEKETSKCIMLIIIIFYLCGSLIKRIFS
jgi:hypothetical protein